MPEKQRDRRCNHEPSITRRSQLYRRSAPDIQRQISLHRSPPSMQTPAAGQTSKNIPRSRHTTGLNNQRFRASRVSKNTVAPGCNEGIAAVNHGRRAPWSPAAASMRNQRPMSEARTDAVVVAVHQRTGFVRRPAGQPGRGSRRAHTCAMAL